LSEVAEDESLELSIQEKMQISLGKSSNFFHYSEICIYVAFIFLLAGLILVFSIEHTIEISGKFVYLDECIGGLSYFDFCTEFEINPEINPQHLIASIYLDYDTFRNVVIISLISLGALIVWLNVRGRSVKKNLRKIRADYTIQAYYFVLSTAIHGKKEDISMDFFDMAEDIFPELKHVDIQSVKKTGEEMDVEELTIYDDKDKKKIKEWAFDVVAKTTEGYFLVKYYDKDKVTHEEIKEIIKVAKDNFKTWTKGVFRLVCLAKSFDNKVLDGYDDLIIKEVPLDLILVREKGFSFAKIGKEYLQ